MQRAHFVEAMEFVSAAADGTGNWTALGFEGGAPLSRFFDFGVTVLAAGANPQTSPASFLAAGRAKSLGTSSGGVVWIGGTGRSADHDQRGVAGDVGDDEASALNGLVPSWNADINGAPLSGRGAIRNPAAPLPTTLPTFPAL
jgi:hypothetical protein